jgi:ribosomal protein S18 acetylase RimI-like enzyme
MAWLHDIKVEEAHRRSGYATAILAAVEELAREAGATQLGLNVFGDNLPAIALYHACGYEVTTQQMAKRLR